MRSSTILACIGVATIVGVAFAGDLEYTIVDLGILDPGDFASQGFGASPGGIAVGRSAGAASQAFSWTEAGGTVGLPNLASRPFGVSNGANDTGMIVGTGSTTLQGSSPLPLVWQGGFVSQLPLPAGETLGRANGVNSAGDAVGSVGGGSVEFAVIYSGGSAAIIAETTAGGSFMTTAYGINDDGLVVGTGIDPSNAARNVGFLYDSVAGTASEVGALPGLNGALCFAVGNGGHVAGSTMLNQGSGTPFIWTQRDGMMEIPLPAGTSQGSARGVNSAGWAVGTASSAFAIPFLFNGKTTQALGDLLPPGSGWDLSTNTFSSAMGISDDGIIIGTGVRDGDIRAYAMIPVVACAADTNGDSTVDVTDLIAVIQDWGTDGSANNGDVDGSGTVDVLDLVEVITSWGPCL